MVTIKDVAKQAGVSIATVSKVVNGYPDVGPKTRVKVMEIIKEMKFHPNTVARGLVKGRSMSIGIFLTTGMAAHPFFSLVIGGMEDVLVRNGYDLYYMVQVGRDRDHYSFVQHIMSRSVDGVIVFGFRHGDPHLNELIEAGIPSIFIDLDMIGERAGYVTSDNRRGIEQAVEYLAELGHRDIACISGDPGNYVGRTRLDGYRNALKEHGLESREDWVAISDFTRESGHACMERLLALPHRPTAVVCCSDHAAIGAIQAAREAGLSVPEDVSVIGFDDLPLTDMLRPALTTVAQDKEEIGKAAVSHLIRLIEDNDCAPPAAHIPTKLVVRESCARAGQGKARAAASTQQDLQEGRN